MALINASINTLALRTAPSAGASMMNLKTVIGAHHAPPGSPPR